MAGNVSNLERLFRIIAGTSLMVWGLPMGGLLGWSLAVLGVIFIISGLGGTCPIYSFFGISTKSCSIK